MNAAKGWVCYDARCPFCQRWAHRLAPFLRAHAFQTVPLQQPWVRAALGPAAPALREFQFLAPGGRSCGGADAILSIAAHIWWARPLSVLRRSPFVMRILRAAYRWVADRRHCLGGACAAPASAAATTDWLPLLFLPTAAFLLSRSAPGWLRMWLLALALFAGCKWLTWARWSRTARGRGRGRARPGWLRTLGYLFLWPGMDAAAFLEGQAVSGGSRSALAAWCFALGKLLFGVVLLCAAVPHWVQGSPLFAGWIGLAGLVFVLHFGFFHVLALAWQSAGVDARPMMRAPILACSLRDFWGRRWNLPFHLLARDFVFTPLRGWLGPSGASLAVFAVSGALHDLVISVPARAGYGLPTLYFLLQGAGAWLESSPWGRRLGLNRGWTGRVVAWCIAGLPVFFLFPPSFVRNVILPFLQVLRVY